MLREVFGPGCDAHLWSEFTLHFPRAGTALAARHSKRSHFSADLSNVKPGGRQNDQCDLPSVAGQLQHAARASESWAGVDVMQGTGDRKAYN